MELLIFGRLSVFQPITTSDNGTVFVCFIFLVTNNGHFVPSKKARKQQQTNKNRNARADRKVSYRLRAT